MSIDEFLSRSAPVRYPFVFVVTFGRSGSTLLQGILNSIPGYCIRGENNSTLFQLFNASSAHAGAHFGHGQKPTDARHPWFGADLFDQKQFNRTLADVFLSACLRPDPDTRCTGFKEIRYTRSNIEDAQFSDYLEFLQTEFPGAALIFNVRRIDHVVESAWWADQPVDDVWELLSDAVTRFEAYADTHSNCFIFDYDRLVANSAYGAELFGFLGEPFDLDALEVVLAKPHSYQPKPSGAARKVVQANAAKEAPEAAQPEKSGDDARPDSAEVVSDGPAREGGSAERDDLAEREAKTPRRLLQRLLGGRS